MTTGGDSPVTPLARTIFWDILDSITDAVITIDEDHRVLMCNKAAEGMFGYSCEEIAGKDVSPLIPDPHHDVHRSYVERYLDTGVARVIGKSRECRGQRRDGKSFPVEISYSVSRTGGRLYFTAVIRDISERKELEREIRFMERLADTGKAVAHIVHEIRKPLMLIGGFARQVEGSEALEHADKERQKLDIIVKEVSRLETLLNGIRLLTRPTGSSQKQSLAVNALLEETIELLDPMLQDHQVELDVDLTEDELIVRADPDQLKQVMLNLLRNALDALDDVGTIRIASSRASETMVQVTVEDNGPGMPEDVQEKIFEPFFTTKPEGTGLGLAISQNIIQDHGGTLTLRSSAQGTTFTITLPLEAPAD